MNFMDPKTDTGFKKLFGDENHKEVIISFLNAVLDRSGDDVIEDVSFAKTENVRHPVEGKQTLLDMHAVDKKGNHYIIEMQNKFQKFFIERTQYYSSFVFSEQLNPNLYFDKLVPVITVSVLNHIFFKHHNDVISHHTLMDMKYNTVTSMFQTFHYIELPKFKKNIEECVTLVDKWLFLMQQAEKCREIPEQVSEMKELVTAFRMLERMSWSYTDMTDYIREQDNATYEMRVLEGAKDIGRQEGLEIGRQEGRQKGRQEGRQEGLEEGFVQAKKDMVVRLLQKGLKVSDIVDLTGLTFDFVEKIAQKKF